MKDNFERLSFANNDEQTKAWEKSADEVAKFILDHLDRPEFLNFVRGQEVDVIVANRWQARLKELFDKAVKRSGHRLEYDELMLAAREQIIKRREAGELETIDAYGKFCELEPEEYSLGR